MTLMCCSLEMYFVTLTDIGLNLSRVFRAATGRGDPAVRVRMNWIRHERWLSFSCFRSNATCMSSLLFTVGRCPPIPYITDAKADSVMALPGNSVTYTCSHGYSFVNKAAEYTINCYNTTWNHSDDMTCQGRFCFLTRNKTHIDGSDDAIVMALGSFLYHNCVQFCSVIH